MFILLHLVVNPGEFQKTYLTFYETKLNLYDKQCTIFSKNNR